MPCPASGWELQRRKSISPHDSVGANLVIQVKHDSVMRVLPRENEAVNECWISDKERFSYQALNSEERLTRPMVKQGGQWREVDWNVALDYVAHGLKDVAHEHGGDAVAALASPASTVEELFLLGKLMRGLGSGNVDFRPRQSDFGSDFKRAGTPWLGMRLAEIADLDAALVVGSFLRKDHPLIAQRLRQAAKKYTKVSLLSVTADDQLIDLYASLAVAPSQLARSLAAIVKAAAELKVGYVNTQRIFRDAPAAQKAGKKLEGEFAKRDQDLQAMAKQIQALQANLEKNSVTMAETERRAKEKEFAETSREFQRRQREFREDLNLRQNEENAAVIEKANKAIKQIAETDKFDLILQDVVWVNPRLDITDRVIKALAEGK